MGNENTQELNRRRRSMIAALVGFIMLAAATAVALLVEHV